MKCITAAKGEGSHQQRLKRDFVVARVLSPDRVDLHQHRIFYQKAGDISTDSDTVVFNSDGELFSDHEAGLRQLMRQGVFVNPFKKPDAQSIGDGESTPNDPFRNFIETFLSGIM